MKRNYFVIVCIVVLIFLFGMMAKLGYALIQQSKVHSISYVSKEKTNNDIMNKFKLVSIDIGDKIIKKPFFGNEVLDLYIDNFVLLNMCDSFNFRIDYLTEDIVNIKLKCVDVEEDKIYDLKKSSFIEFKELINDEEIFVSKVYSLLNLKYPKFVSDEVDIVNGKYIINNNEIILTYNTLNYGEINLKINNNEIKDLLIYEMEYDESYENEVFKLDPNKKTIAFTFDDGPSTYDIEIVDSLVQSHSTATFFIVGSRINNFERSIKHIVNNGMEVGNHSYDHKSLSKISNDAVLFQINETNNIFESMTNKKISLLRPPYGSFKENIHALSNMPVILWNIDTLDWKYRDTKKVYDSILNNLNDGDIILMHSLFETTKDAVIKVLPELYKRGYQIVSVSELAKIKGINLEVGKVYRSFNLQ